MNRELMLLYNYPHVFLQVCHDYPAQQKGWLTGLLFHVILSCLLPQISCCANGPRCSREAKSSLWSNSNCSFLKLFWLTNEVWALPPIPLNYVYWAIISYNMNFIYVLMCSLSKSSPSLDLPHSKCSIAIMWIWSQII